MNRTIRDFADDPRIPSDEQWDFFCECGCFPPVARRASGSMPEPAMFGGA